MDTEFIIIIVNVQIAVMVQMSTTLEYVASTDACKILIFLPV